MVLLNSEEYQVDRGSKYHGNMAIFVFEGVVRSTSETELNNILNWVNIMFIINNS